MHIFFYFLDSHQKLSSYYFEFDFLLSYDLFLLTLLSMIQILSYIGDRFCILVALVLIALLFAFLISMKISILGLFSRLIPACSSIELLEPSYVQNLLLCVRSNSPIIFIELMVPKFGDSIGTHHIFHHQHMAPYTRTKQSPIHHP